MFRAAADTHALIWYVLGNPLLSSVARRAFDDAAAAGESIAVSSISLVEMAYLIEKNRIDPSSLVLLLAILDLKKLLIEVPVDRHVLPSLTRINRAIVPDLPDRVIAATALRFNVPLITRDGRIRASLVPTVW